MTNKNETTYNPNAGSLTSMMNEHANLPVETKNEDTVIVAVERMNDIVWCYRVKHGVKVTHNKWLGTIEVHTYNLRVVRFNLATNEPTWQSPVFSGTYNPATNFISPAVSRKLNARLNDKFIRKALTHILKGRHNWSDLAGMQPTQVTWEDVEDDE